MSGPASPSSTSNSRDSPLLSPCRRGSVAAPDPFGTLLVHNNERGLSSTLTITKAPSNAQMQEVDIKTSRRRSTGYYNNPPSGGGHRDNGRISFAFSTFSPISRDSAIGPRGMDDASRPTSPFNPRVLPRSNSFTALETALNPMQVYEVAQQCNYPHSQPSTPGGNISLPSTPVSYTPLPATVYLPFLDRPREVEALISTPPTSAMFSLLAQTFPTSFDAEENTEPARWSYTKLKQWLTKVDRSEAEDLEWVQKARTCISTRSELIWERIKGALGVPPEFDVFPSEPTRDLGESGVSSLNSPLDDRKGAKGDQDHFDEAWVEPIVSSLPLQPLSQSPTSECGHFPFLSRQNSARMQDIAEDDPVPDPVPASPPSTVHGLRIITSPLETASRPESSPQTSAGSFSHLQVPYDVVAERGPGNPLFPSSFANLALRPTLSANAALRPPASAYTSLHATSRRRNRASSWADSWHPQKQAEYAASTAST